MANIDMHGPMPEVVDRVKGIVMDQYKAGVKVRAYGFGFLRVPLDNAGRLKTGHALNVWTEGLRTDESPHTHLFELESRVLAESVVNTQFSVELGEDYAPTRVWYSAYGEGIIEPPNSKHVGLHRGSSVEVHAGQTYIVPRGYPHTSQASPGAVTLIHRIDPDPALPNIHFQRAGAGPLPSFPLGSCNQHYAWGKVFDALERISPR